MVCTAQILIEYLAGFAGVEAVRAHARSCDDCAERTRGALDATSQSTLAERLGSDPRLHFSAMLEQTIGACERVMEVRPWHAYNLAVLACRIGDALESSAIIPLQAISWTRRAAALRAIGQLDAAMDAISEAEVRARRLPAADLELALVSYTAAHILRERGEYTKALARITTARDVFVRFRDVRHAELARELEATLHYRLGAYECAHAIFTTLLQSRAQDDVDGRARLALSAGHSALALQRQSEAEALYTTARTLFQRLELPPHVARADWGLARLRFARAEDDQGFVLLRSVREQFAAIGMVPEWVRASVELVEHLVRVHEFTEARATAEAAYSAALKASMRPNAVEALAYLREAAQRDVLSFEEARYVREYVERAASAPAFSYPAR